jgi:rhamnogalacturonyl hydrolase YesR
MNDSPLQRHEPSTPFPQRMPDGPVVTADLEALVGRPFIRSIMERVMEFQEGEYAGNVQIDWQAGTYYTGVLAAHLATGEISFREAALGWGSAAGWKIGPRPFYADDICMGQTMLDLYLLDRDPSYITDLASMLEGYFIKETVTAVDVHSHFLKPGIHPMQGRNLWWWCDALYMAPPVLARMHAATGEPRYLDLLHRLYWDACAFLFDQESSLFYRDESFFPSDRSVAEERDKIFWSRGNGWVYAGLIRVLDYLPSADPVRPRYLELFHKLTRKIVTLQRNDGLWSSWLNRPDLEQSPEVSGSCFFAYGLLAGIKRGWLDTRSYLPPALRAWRGITARLGTDGRLGFAQLVDSAPGAVRPESSIDYTHGAFLLAASELYSLDLNPTALRNLEPSQQPRLMMADACWSPTTTERAVFGDDHTYLGAVNGAGHIRLHAYRNMPDKAPSILNGNSDIGLTSRCDDRNHPALLRFDDKLLAVYPGTETRAGWRWRIASIPRELPDWGAMKIEWSEERSFLTECSSPICSGLARLQAEEGRIFHFFGDSQVTWSDDDGDSWKPSIRLLDQRGTLVRIHSNGWDRVDLVFSRVDGGLNHFFYQHGGFHASDGRTIGNLSGIAHRPIPIGMTTRVSKDRVSIQDLRLDMDGRPITVFATAADGLNLTYHTARWDGGKWISRQVGFAGAALDGGDSLAAAGIVIDPEQCDLMYLSTNVDAVTGAANATGRYQIFRTILTESTDCQKWEQLTFDANRDNFHPYVPNGCGSLTCVLWLRGTWRSHDEFQTDIYGLLEDGRGESEKSMDMLAPHASESIQQTTKPQVPSGLMEAV